MGLELAHETVLITGGSRGIGLAIAEALAPLAGRLLLVARDRTRLEHAAATLRERYGCEVAVAVRDLSEPEGVDAWATELAERHGPIGVLVNNAGVYRTGWIVESDPAEWDRMLDVNLRTPMRLVRALLPGMIARQRGAIVQIGSIAGLHGYPRNAGYNASKFGLRGFTLALFEEVRRYGIVVTHVCPGFVDTDLVADLAGLDRSRMIRPEDVAGAVRWALTTAPQTVPLEIVLHPQRSVFV